MDKQKTGKQRGLLFVFGATFSALIALGVIALSIVLPLHTSSSLEDILQNTMLPQVRSGFEKSNQAINKELDALKQTLVLRVNESYANEYKNRADGLVKSAIPFIENYFIDGILENVQKEVDRDPKVAGIRYRIREKEDFTLVGDTSSQAMLEYSAEKNSNYPGLEFVVLVPQAVVTQAEDEEKASIDKIVNELSVTSKAVEDGILVDAHMMQVSVISTLKQGIWVMMVLAGIAMVGISVFLIRRTIILPLHKTKAHLLAIAEGDLSKELDYSSNNELGEMANAMNAMVRNLRRIVSDINNSVATVSNHSEGLTGTTQELVKGAVNQAGMADQAAAAMTEMSQSFIEVARNATSASASARESNGLAQSGRTQVADTAAGMTSIAATTAESSTLIEELGRGGEKISSIVSVIEDIAGQTNLLALNAAIEAARAGEQGRGFAVVADEVRNLAARTSEATKEIGQMIEKIQLDTARSVSSMNLVNEQVSQGVEQAGDAQRAMDGIVDASDVSLQLIERITAAVEEQSAAAEQVTVSVETIAGVSKSTEDLSDTLRLASQELSGLSDELETTIGWFKVS